MDRSPLEVIRDLKKERYKEAKVIFWAGSVAKNIGTKTSDLDVVIIYDSLPCAYREAFLFQGWLIDAFMHDPETLLYFFEKIDKASLNPSLPQMIVEGIEIPFPSDLSLNLKCIAKALLDEGPKSLEQWQIDYKRFLITDLLADIQSPRNKHEQLVSGMRFYRDLAEFYLLTNGRWIGNGKGLVRCLEDFDQSMASEFFEAFELFFTKGDLNRIKGLTLKILEPFGGMLWEGFKLDAPKDWRLRKELR